MQASVASESHGLRCMPSGLTILWADYSHNYRSFVYAEMPIYFGLYTFTHLCCIRFKSETGRYAAPSQSPVKPSLIKQLPAIRSHHNLRLHRTPDDPAGRVGSFLQGLDGQKCISLHAMDCECRELSSSTWMPTWNKSKQVTV